ncbi:MAG: TonB-dependent receptor [Rhizomicrobium sp.]
MKNGPWYVALASLFALMATGARAQDLAVAAQPGEASHPPKKAETTGIETIVVTATRRDERLHDIPAQVSALSGDTLKKLNAKNVVDFAALTPGLSFESSSPGTNLVAIRGVTTGQAQLNSAVGLYLDDVPLGSSTPNGAGAFTPNIGLFDLNRIEVLNGPQGTLFGANALGGTLRYITDAPNLDSFSGIAEAEGAYTDDKGGGSGALRGALNVPIIDGRLGFRAEGVDEYDAGYIDDPDHGRHNLGDARTYQGRASLLFQIDDDFSVQLNGFGQKVQSNGLAAAYMDPVTGKPVQGPYEISSAVPQPSQVELYLGSAVVNGDLHWAKLTSITAWQHSQLHDDSDLSVAYGAVLGAVFGPAAIQPYVLRVNAWTDRFTQEIRLTSESDQAFEWIVGAFYSSEQTFQSDNILNEADPNGFLFGLPIGQFLLPSKSRDIALYGDGTYHFSDQLDATVGIRYNWNDQVFTSHGSGALVNPANPFGTLSVTGKSNDQVATYLFNLRYRPTEDTMIYGRIANGYRPGGPNLITGGAGSGNASFQPDRLWNYELGLRQNFGDGGSFVNLSAYHIDWSDIQQVTNIGGVNQLINAGNARINGVEASASVHILSGLNVDAAAAYTDAKLNDPTPILGIGYPGARLPLTAHFTFTAAPRYDFELGNAFTGSAILAFRYVGDRTAGYAGSAVEPLYKLPSYETVDLDLSLRNAAGWELDPYLKNIFDARGQISANTVTNQYVPSAPVPVVIEQPRTVGIVLRKEF